MTKQVKPHVAVIGAGVTGLATIRNLQKEGLAVTCFEKSGQLGGLWNYRDAKTFPQDIRKTNLSLQGSIYKGLRSNLPYPLMMFPDLLEYPCGKEKTLTLYPEHQVVAQYLQSYANKYNLAGAIRFGCEVLDVSQIGSRWQISWKETGSAKLKTEVFDKLVICNGHYNKPNIPNIAGMDKFRGVVTHSHCYRRPELFKGKRVVMLGMGNSGEDISLEISPYAKHIYLCCGKGRSDVLTPDRGRPYGAGSNITHHSGIKACTSQDIVLEDGSRLQNIDVVMLSTGYTYDFPFIQNLADIGLKLGERTHLSSLYGNILSTSPNNGICQHSLNHHYFLDGMVTVRLGCQSVFWKAEPA